MNDASAKPPTWFWIVSILILLWGAMGVFAFYTDVTMSEEMLAAMDDYDRRMYLGRPAWFATVYGLATWGGFLGGVALLLRRRLAIVLFLLSTVAVVVQFGWVFGVTDLIAEKGAWTLIFPIFILAIAIFQIWFANLAIKRGWLR
ncbi:hypothetical protein ACX0GZ_12015 [Sphingomonas aestuarii]